MSFADFPRARPLDGLLTVARRRGFCGFTGSACFAAGWGANGFAGGVRGRVVFAAGGRRAREADGASEGRVFGVALSDEPGIDTFADAAKRDAAPV